MSQTHYEARLEADLNEIRNDVLAVAGDIEKGLQNSLRALLALDKKLAYQTVLDDKPINRAIAAIDKRCHSFVARHLPTAGHLRFISSVLRMTVELERIGDYAVTICRETVQLDEELEPSVRREAERVGKNTFQMYRQAIRAFREQNADLARATMGYADQIDRSFASVFEELVEDGKARKRSVRDLFGTLSIFNKIERVSDQAKNICEETVFAATGETKQPKRYRILFLDKNNDYLGPLAVTIAKKAFPESGDYSTAGLDPKDSIDSALGGFMEERGVEIAGEKPRAIDWVPEEWTDIHVIVALEGEVGDYLKDVPYSTVALQWEVEQNGELQDKPRFEDVYRQLAEKIQTLIETLRGPEAS